MIGVATPREAERLLGVAGLRRSRKIVRPDLYGNAEVEFGDDLQSIRSDGVWAGPTNRSVGAVGSHRGCDRSAGQRKDTRSSDSGYAKRLRRCPGDSQAMSLFFQEDIRRRCVPNPGRPATDLAEVIRRCGTVYLLGREDP